jgi:large subunit ribosomal protein L23
MVEKQKKPVAPAVVTPATFDVLLAPHVTEKATMGSSFNQVTFKVALNATKPQIKMAVEALFKVQVKGVNTIRIKGKAKRFKGRLGQRSDYKKAIITLAAGEVIDMATGI